MNEIDLEAIRKRAAISPSDPATILAGIRQFGLAADGSDLRDLESALAARDKQIEELKRLGKIGDGAIAILTRQCDELRVILQKGIDLIRGDAVGIEWKKGCKDFVENARAALKECGDIEDIDPCPVCGDGDRVPDTGYWRCPHCDAEWNDA